MVLHYKYTELSNRYMVKKVLLVFEIIVLYSSQESPGFYVDLTIKRLNFYTALAYCLQSLALDVPRYYR